MTAANELNTVNKRSTLRRTDAERVSFGIKRSVVCTYVTESLKMRWPKLGELFLDLVIGLMPLD